MALIELSDVSRLYGSGAQTIAAVDHFTAQIERGEFTVFAGPSGSGKTTLLNLIGCLDKPTGGTLTIDGRNVAESAAAKLADFRLRRIGFIFQSYNLIPVLSAEENAEFTLMLQGVPKPQRQERVRSLFADLGLAGLEQRRPDDLSGGQQQRVAIARAIAPEPAVVLADEPTANLDSSASNDLLQLMRQLNEVKGITFIFSSHDPRVIDLARRVITLEDGRLAADETR
jgi:putative ABC transport system ATP-binding protein